MNSRRSASPAARWLPAVAAGGLLAVLVWFAFTFQIMLGQFFKFESNPFKGWINQPLVQMPWFDLVPPELKKAAREERKSNR